MGGLSIHSPGAFSLLFNRVGNAIVLSKKKTFQSRIFHRIMPSMTPDQPFEYEERAFLAEDQFLQVKHELAKAAQTSTLDNKISYFFVLPDVNISIAASPDKTVVKYKGGQLGRGNGFEEHEFSIQPDALPEAIKLFSSLLKLAPQVSEQFRINYDMGNNIEVALKYTQMWGFHLELEKLYTATDGTKHEQAAQAKHELETVAEQLVIHFITDEAMERFKAEGQQGMHRGQYSAEEFRAKYGSLFSKVAISPLKV
jgi:hypothetical protein